ncbi:NUDIX hydrolase [Paenarthrobacter ilicis]|uniref:8-oxo-dGTP diphosphatase n=1 Tax=Paenarthrobacter ilicis TaxID=43665 RepID=A0ABX0TGM4_9MICC|nr:NUDIX domain-containing protein [Paenarthrobacter ilicis]MBM7793896.1 8-oxo-dGTP diphosphatase [Paenarthrobacter ilicis]NIJ00076.1 8-oxo-dGTP diphosphatase [Paenarthrobacter ilicis]
MSLQFDTRPAAYAVIIKDQKILLAYWKEDGKEGWTLPGGGLDLAEHPVDGCKREVFEETGYKASIDRMLGIDVGHWPGEPRKDGSHRDFESLRLVYEGTVVGGELTHEVDGSTTHAAWIPLTDVEKLTRVSLVDIGLRLHSERPVNGKLAAGPPTA